MHGKNDSMYRDNSSLKRSRKNLSPIHFAFPDQRMHGLWCETSHAVLITHIKCKHYDYLLVKMENMKLSTEGRIDIYCIYVFLFVRFSPFYFLVSVRSRIDSSLFDVFA